MSASTSGPEAFAAVYARFGPRVLGFLQRALGDPVLAEDASHEVFLKAYRAMLGDDPPRNMAAWLFRVASTTAIDVGALRGREVLLAPEAIMAVADRAVLERRAGWISDPEVAVVVAGLPDRQREVLVLRYAIGCSHAQAARVLAVRRHRSAKPTSAPCWRSARRSRNQRWPKSVRPNGSRCASCACHARPCSPGSRCWPHRWPHRWPASVAGSHALEGRCREIGRFAVFNTEVCVVTSFSQGKEPT